MCVTSLVADSVKVTVRELVAGAPPLMATLPVARHRLGTRQQNERHELGFHAEHGADPSILVFVEPWVRVRANGRGLRPSGV